MLHNSVVQHQFLRFHVQSCLGQFRYKMVEDSNLGSSTLVPPLLFFDLFFLLQLSSVLSLTLSSTGPRNGYL